ncbi:hypothetical protein J4230_04930 [Candidatus Woesearchaeota archaeon]|nr:hypothetical protein [Candidatus Woesearchaeota archaeon]
MLEYNLSSGEMKKYNIHGVISFNLNNLTWNGFELTTPSDLRHVWVRHGRLIIAKDGFVNLPDERLTIEDKKPVNGIKVLPSRYDLDFQRRLEYQLSSGSLFPHGRIGVTREFLELYKQGAKLFRRKVEAFDGVYIAVAPMYKNQL